jgi:hypothetical protein
VYIQVRLCVSKYIVSSHQVSGRTQYIVSSNQVSVMTHLYNIKKYVTIMKESVLMSICAHNNMKRMLSI